jgi:hypothetical protein
MTVTENEQLPMIETLIYSNLSDTKKTKPRSAFEHSYKLSIQPAPERLQLANFTACREALPAISSHQSQSSALLKSHRH